MSGAPRLIHDPVPDVLRALEVRHAQAVAWRRRAIDLGLGTLEEVIYHLRRLTDQTPRTRAGGPDTSRAAAARVSRCQGRHHDAIRVALREGGPRTAREIAAWLAVSPRASGLAVLATHAVGKRLGELVRAGYVERTAEVRGGMAVYRVVPQAPGQA